MGSLHKLFLIGLLILALPIHGALGDAMVSGTVFCDQCRDGYVSLFDYPVNGVKVVVACTDGNGQVTMWKEETTNWFGSFSMKFDGTPDLSSCYAQVEQGSKGCGAAGGPARALKLMFKIFDMEMYTVESLISQPAEPMSYCPRSTTPVPGPVTPIAPVTPVPVPVTPITPPAPVTVPVTPTTPAPVVVPVTPTTPPPAPVKPPAFKLPPMPHLPPLPLMPPVPFAEASACSHERWTMPEFKCYWKAVNPDTKVASVFGIVAARRYGNDMTLWSGLQGRGDPYRTLLREGTTALLNSFSSLQFPYNTLGVVQRMNWALIGTQQDVLLTAVRFKRANSGSGRFTCKLMPCK